MFKKVSIITIIAVVVVSLAIVAIARYQRTVYPTVARGLSVATDNGLSDLAADTLIAPDKATAAPEFAQGVWINSDPLTLEKLRGRVVLVEFWAFNCDNCRNTLPSVTGWDARYREQGLTIVGVHTPETQSEYVINIVRREVPSLGIKYPVVTDNDYQTWKAYGVEAWPTIFAIDKHGRIRWKHVGEGRYEETDTVIKALLAEQT